MALALLLDVDGTLFDSFESILLSMNKALAEQGEPPLRDADLRPLIGMPVRRQMSLIRGMDGPAVTRLGQRYYAHFEERVAEGIALYPGVRETLEALAERPIGTITTRRTAVAQRMLAGADLLQFFEAVTGGDAVSRPKPAPDLVRYAAKAIGRAVSDTVAVGDSPVDLMAGQAAGARTVAALYGYGGIRALREVEPDGEIQGFSQLPAVLMDLEADPAGP